MNCSHQHLSADEKTRRSPSFLLGPPLRLCLSSSFGAVYADFPPLCKRTKALQKKYCAEATTAFTIRCKHTFVVVAVKSRLSKYFLRRGEGKNRQLSPVDRCCLARNFFSNPTKWVDVQNNTNHSERTKGKLQSTILDLPFESLVSFSGSDVRFARYRNKGKWVAWSAWITLEDFINGLAFVFSCLAYWSSVDHLIRVSNFKLTDRNGRRHWKWQKLNSSPSLSWFWKKPMKCCDDCQQRKTPSAPLFMKENLEQNKKNKERENKSSNSDL